ncbi:MAG TPA: DUF3472 domain-containing protein [Bryobacteraceae bacterium]|nr:DUF3472 domain-containing protein [Bryobacteraceae bacterium]
MITTADLTRITASIECQLILPSRPRRLSSASKALLLAAFAGASCLFGQPAPSGWLCYGPTASADMMMTRVRSTITAPSTFYEALGWNGGAAGGGYYGIQDNWDQGKNFIFSLWDAPGGGLSTLVYANPAGAASRFGGEGTGVHYLSDNRQWQVNRWYRLVARAWNYNNQTYFAAWSFDETGGTWTHHATLAYPLAGMHFEDHGWTCSFIEDFGNSGANVRRVEYSDGWKRSPSRTWEAYTLGHFRLNASASFNGPYYRAYDAGVQNGVYYMQTGGNTRPGVDPQTDFPPVQPVATSPARSVGRNVSASASYDAISNHVSVSWTSDRLYSPQFSYRVDIFGTPAMNGAPVATQSDIAPHTRAALLKVPPLSSGASYYARVTTTDIFDQPADPVTAVVAAFCNSTSVAPTSVTIPAAGGSAQIMVNAPPGCPWSVTGAAGFTVTGGGMGQGTATIAATSANDSSKPRPSVSVIVAGKGIAVTQLGLPCSDAELSVSGLIPRLGGWAVVDVGIPRDCPWSATQSGAWFRMDTASGNGPGHIRITANGANSKSVTLTGSVSAAGRQVNVTQQRTPFTGTLDHDGDQHADPLVWRPYDGTWYLMPSSGHCPFNFAAYAYTADGRPNCQRQFGLPGDIPITADFDGDNRKDLAVWRPSIATYFMEPSGSSCPAGWTSTHNTDGSPMCTRRLAAGSLTPIAGDFDGDGRADMAFFRSADQRWILVPSSGPAAPIFNEIIVGTDASARQFGIPGDHPAPGDYDGDGTTDIALYRPGSPGVMILLPSSGSCPAHWSQVDPTPDQHKVCIRVAGASDDWPVPADYDGDGTTDQTLFRSRDQVWTVFPSRSVAPGILSNPRFTAESQPYSSRQWGLPNDIPAPADFDGDQKADLTVFRPAEGKWYVFPSTGVCPLRIPRAGTTPDGRSVCVVQWGLPGDIPLP